MTTSDHVFEEILLREPPPLRITHARLPVEQIAFDAANPRLRYLKEMNPDKTERQLLFLEPDTAWLKKDVFDKGVIDAIYVKRLPQTEGSLLAYVVIEGNRRLSVCQELREEHPENPRFMTMPARVLPDSTTDEQCALLMASFHIAGKVKWDAHEKAGHIYHMLRRLHIPGEEMAATLHMGVPAIKRTAQSYETLEEVYKRVDGGKYAGNATGKWSFFDQLFRVKGFAKSREDAAWLAEFCRWVGEGRLPRAEDVRVLPEILLKAEPRHIFTNEAADVAFQRAKNAADTTNPAARSNFFAILEKAISACRQATLDDMELASNNDAARTILTDAYQSIGAFMERAGVRLPPPAPRRVA